MRCWSEGLQWSVHSGSVVLHDRESSIETPSKLQKSKSTIVVQGPFRMSIRTISRAVHGVRANKSITVGHLKY